MLHHLRQLSQMQLSLSSFSHTINSSSTFFISNSSSPCSLEMSTPVVGFEPTDIHSEIRCLNHLAKECQLRKHGNFDYLSAASFQKFSQVIQISDNFITIKDNFFKVIRQSNKDRDKNVCLNQEMLYKNKKIARFFYELSFLKII